MKTEKLKERYKKIIIAIDSFKGCLTSIAAADAAKKGIHHLFPNCEVVCLPMADGGEGLIDVLLTTSKGKRITCTAHDPLFKLRRVDYAISGDGQTAYIEMARISGLPLVPREQQNPMLTTTFGTGELLLDALERGCRHFIIGIGGSATNDAGLGMLQALGFHLLDKNGNRLTPACGEMLAKITKIDNSNVHPALHDCSFTVACDVQNPFYGPQGAASVFAPQKGATPQMVKQLDDGLQHIATVIQQTTGKEISHTPGAGAAGGMGGTLLAFLHATLTSGIQLLLEAVDFPRAITDADLIITGEGQADRQTLMGKVPFGVLTEAKKQQIPVVLLAGSIADKALLQAAGFKEVVAINSTTLPLEEAMQPEIARRNIEQTVKTILSL
ncbi:MAG: glycerate kinase [Bacteroidaceae bacterium]|nr:glycerate kinase [Bacteroidaceae bacterium]